MAMGLLHARRVNTLPLGGVEALATGAETTPTDPMRTAPLVPLLARLHPPHIPGTRPQAKNYEAIQPHHLMNTLVLPADPVRAGAVQRHRGLQGTGHTEKDSRATQVFGDDRQLGPLLENVAS